MAGFMSKCPFWSTTKEKVECYNECPILISELYGGQNGDKCIFHECTESNNMDFKEIIREDYSFLDLSIYDEDKRLKITY